MNVDIMYVRTMLPAQMASTTFTVSALTTIVEHIVMTLTVENQMKEKPRIKVNRKNYGIINEAQFFFTNEPTYYYLDGVVI